MRAYVVPIIAAVAIGALTWITAMRDLSPDRGPSDPAGYAAAPTGDPVVTRNGARGSGPRFKSAPSSSPEEAPAGTEASGPPLYEQAVALLVSLGLVGEPEPERPLAEVERSGFEKPTGRTSAKHDFSGPDVDSDTYRAQTPSYPTTKDRFGKPSPPYRNIRKEGKAL